MKIHKAAVKKPLPTLTAFWERRQKAARNQLPKHLRPPAIPMNPSSPAKLTLTTKQVELVQYIANGKRTEDIALLMNTSIPAVKNQLFRIMNMTGCASRSSLVSWAFRRKLIC